MESHNMKPMVRIYTEPDKFIDREMTAAEFAQYQADLAAREARVSEQAAKDEAKAALLERLGITADEAALLLG
jgi:hypothetical protein